MHSTTTKSQQSGGVIGHYREFLPISPATPIISLGEGDTPLIYSPRLSERVGRRCEVFVKNEGVNPTGSFKDRGMTVAVSKAVERGTTALICASTGNTSASAAAYAARAGISCVVILPAGKIATGKLLQAFAYGARIVAIDEDRRDTKVSFRAEPTCPFRFISHLVLAEARNLLRCCFAEAIEFPRLEENRVAQPGSPADPMLVCWGGQPPSAVRLLPHLKLPVLLVLKNTTNIALCDPI